MTILTSIYSREATASIITGKWVGMPFNLLFDPFFPIVTRDGRRRWATFAELSARGGGEPVEFDWPRADFNVAALEFAVGVTLMAFQPEKPSEWRRFWADPPGPDEVAKAIKPFAHAFALDGAGPRFMQELGGIEGEATPVEALLIDTPGANGQKKNADLLTHRDRYPALGLPAAAIALYALQQFAPSGGAGNRTSMRGGGPMSTFVLPGGVGGSPTSLWRTIIANLPSDESFAYDVEDLPKILPWLAPTRISDKAHGERLVSEQDDDVHPLQAFFGMPRRIALRYVGVGRCALTDESGALVDAFAQKPWGVNYGVWQHPLTPYRRQKEGAEPYSVKPKSARFGYRDWTPVVVGADDGGLASPARNVAFARGERRDDLRGDAPASLRAAGWAMNNMEAIAYLHAEQPLHLAVSEDAQRTLDGEAKRFAKAADTVVVLLVQALRSALFSEGAKSATDKTLFEQARAHFYEATENAFHALLDERLSASLGLGDGLSNKWLSHIRRAAFAAFQAGAPLPLDEPERARRIAVASKYLGLALAGYGKAGRTLFESLDLIPPEAPKPVKGTRHGK